jgi:DNA-damage-inducible protein J
MTATKKSYHAPTDAEIKPTTRVKPLAFAGEGHGSGMSPRVKAKPRRNRATVPEDFKTSMLTLRVKDDLKEQATATLAKVGISLPEAIRVFLGRVVSEQGFPFPLHVPNAETAAALRDSMASDNKRYTSVEEMFDVLDKGGVN